MAFCLRAAASRAALALSFAATLALGSFPSALAQQRRVPAATGATEEQLTQWHENLKNYAPLQDGCFHTAYPSVQWEKVTCGPNPAFVSSHKAKAAAAAAAASREKSLPLEFAGNGNDYVAQTAGITRASHGSFPIATGITSEKGVPNPEYGKDGIFGKNEYSLQLNSDIDPSSVACGAFGYGQCYVWAQFVYSTAGDHYPTEIFIQNWVFPSPRDYGNLGCPDGWADASGPGEPACVTNSDAVVVPDVLPQNLGMVKLSGSVSGGKNTIIFSANGDAYTVSQLDSTTHLSSWWKQSEFNVVGNAGGAEAVFNKGTSLGVKIVVQDGSTNPPTCVAYSGTTGESNNLNLGPCTATGGKNPAITFSESN